jgi:hypothetical protein
MKLSLTEHIFAENKTGQSDTLSWKFEMTRTIAALYNSGGGILRVGVDDNGTVSGVSKPHDYSADKSVLTKTLDHYLDPVPPFESFEKDGYVEINIREGVTSPSILKTELERPNDSKKFSKGTVFIRRINGGQPSSEPPQTRSDWQTALHLWETNRGVVLQGPLLAQFCLVINEWDPFPDAGFTNTGVTVWKAHCIADAAGTLGRDKLKDGLKKIIQKMRPATDLPAFTQNRNQAGADYKQPFLTEVEQLCQELGLSVSRLGR